ncbi:hypothetical protein NUSPORA_02923 [Nucleospora cyclopteri]
MIKKIIDDNLIQNGINEYNKNTLVFKQKIETIYFFTKCILLFVNDSIDDTAYCYIIESILVHFFCTRLYLIDDIVFRKKPKNVVLNNEILILNKFFQKFKNLNCNLYNKKI